MTKAVKLIGLAIIAILTVFTSCKKDEELTPNNNQNKKYKEYKQRQQPKAGFEAQENDLFYFSGSGTNYHGSPLVYYFKDGKFNNPNANSLEALKFDLLSNSTLQVNISDGQKYNDYILANKVPIGYNDYGTFTLTTGKEGIYNGLWLFPNKNFILALNSGTNTAKIYFYGTNKLYTRNYTFKNDSAGNPNIAIDTLNLGQGPERWTIGVNMISPTSYHTGVATLTITDEGNNQFSYANGLLIVDDKR
ncbi:MAG: hypothetical protein WCK37_04400 [Candidatus Falkowbacteria bacterium]